MSNDIFTDGYVKHISSAANIEVVDPSGELHQLTGDELVAHIARVSNPSNQFNHATAPKLINYLIKHKHWSPFEMTNMVLEIKTSRGIAAQVLRHRSFSFQEFSQRYSQASECINIELRAPDDKNRQSSTTEIDNDNLKAEVEDHIVKTFDLYYKLINSGVAKECARGLLPLNTSTTMYMNGTLRSWIHYIEIRNDITHVQKEHVEIAEAAKQIICERYPLISKALNWIE